MNKFAIFVEGQTEQIFVTKLIYQIYGYQIKLNNKDKIRGKNLYITIEKNDDTHLLNYLFLIIDVGTDERVASAMRENAPNMISKGFNKIIGLRDLFPHNRKNEEKIRKAIQKEILQSPYSSKLIIHLAVMEIEAWFIADFNLFQNIDSRLTHEYIQQQLNYDLVNDDPEIAYKHPAVIIQKIYNLVGKKYRKREDDSYKIVNNIDFDYLYLDVKKLNKINSFFCFLNEIENI